MILVSEQRFKSEAHNETLKKLTRLHLAVMMIRDYSLLIESHHIHRVIIMEKYAKQNCCNI